MKNSSSIDDCQCCRETATGAQFSTAATQFESLYQIDKQTRIKRTPESPILQLSWIISSADKLSILSVGRYTYTSDLRFQPVMRDDSTDDSETWTLRIRRVKLEDEAKYECQINTKPEKSRHIYLRVVGEFSRSSLLFSAALFRLIPL